MEFIKKINNLIRPHKVKEIIEEVDGVNFTSKVTVSFLEFLDKNHIE